LRAIQPAVGTRPPLGRVRDAPCLTPR